jgi:hypothetical protein
MYKEALASLLAKALGGDDVVGFSPLALVKGFRMR